SATNLSQNCKERCYNLPHTRRSSVNRNGRVTMRMLSTALGSLLAAILLSTYSTPLHAQSSQGGLRGVVKDSQGVIPGVTVTMVNEANGVSRDTVTNGVGEYSFPAIEPGTYIVKATVQGYKTFERKGVPVSVQTFVGLDIT